MGGFFQTRIALNIELDPEVLEITDATNAEELLAGNYMGVIRNALLEGFPDGPSRNDKRSLYGMVSVGATYNLRDRLKTKPELLGTTISLWVLADDDVDTYYKSLSSTPYAERMSEKSQAWVQELIETNQIKKVFNTHFFTDGDSSEPEMAGIRGAILGSLFTMLVTLILSFPVGVAASDRASPCPRPSAGIVAGWGRRPRRGGGAGRARAGDSVATRRGLSRQVGIRSGPDGTVVTRRQGREVNTLTSGYRSGHDRPQVLALVQGLLELRHLQFQGVAGGDHPQRSAVLGHRHVAETVLVHQVQGVHEGFIRVDGDRIERHHRC